MKEKSGFLWNTAGSFVYAFFNALILLFCKRINGTEIAGIFSICYATGCILNAIGDFGIRIYQVTDTERKYKFEDYIYSRIIAIGIMLISTVLFIFIGGYTNEKLFICMIIIGIRVVDNFGETFQAEFQLRSRLDLAGKVLLFRNILEICVFSVVDLVTKNIYISFTAMLIVSVISFFIFDFRWSDFKNSFINRKMNGNRVKTILKDCFPLALSTLISMYVINSVKYAIDIYGNNEMQTYFNILYMPTFVINLISIFIMKPFLKNFGDYWNNKEYKSFKKTIAKIIAFLGGCTIIIEIGAIFVGIPILNIIYGVDLGIYKFEMFLLILSGLFYAISTVVFYALGTIRKQKWSTVAYAVSSVFALGISNLLVKKYEMLGATISSVAIMFVLFVILTTVFELGFHKEKMER